MVRIKTRVMADCRSKQLAHWQTLGAMCRSCSGLTATVCDAQGPVLENCCGSTTSKHPRKLDGLPCSGACRLCECFFYLDMGVSG